MPGWPEYKEGEVESNLCDLGNKGRRGDIDSDSLDKGLLSLREHPSAVRMQVFYLVFQRQSTY